MRVLVAEEDKDRRSPLVEMLREWGYEAEAVSSFAEATRVLNSATQPVLVLLDWDLPGCRGLSSVRDLRRREAGAALYVVVLTRRRQKPFFVEALYAGANDCLARNCKPGELRLHLEIGRAVLDSRQGVSNRLAKPFRDRRANYSAWAD